MTFSSQYVAILLAQPHNALRKMDLYTGQYGSAYSAYNIDHYVLTLRPHGNFNQ